MFSFVLFIGHAFAYYIDYYINYKGPSWPWSYHNWIYSYLCNQCLSPMMLWVRILIRTRCTTLCDKVCQWLATDRWFSPGPSVSSTNKTDHHDISEILLRVALNTIKQANKHILITQLTLSCHQLLNCPLLWLAFNLFLL